MSGTQRKMTKSTNEFPPQAPGAGSRSEGQPLGKDDIKENKWLIDY